MLEIAIPQRRLASSLAHLGNPYSVLPCVAGGLPEGVSDRGSAMAEGEAGRDEFHQVLANRRA